MQISLTESFIESLAGLAPADGKRAAAFLHRLLRAPDASGLRPEIVHDAGDRTIRSFKVTRDMRAIGHLEHDKIVLMFVGRHDAAYEWAKNRCVECHPVTGEIQIVADPTDAERALASDAAALSAARIATSRPPATGLFDGFSNEYLLSIGVPPSWLPTIHMVRTEEMLLAIAPDLPESVSERLVAIATGELVSPACIDQRCIDSQDSAEDGNVRHWVCTIKDGESLCQLLEDVGIESLPDV